VQVESEVLPSNAAAQVTPRSEVAWYCVRCASHCDFGESPCFAKQLGGQVEIESLASRILDASWCSENGFESAVKAYMS
jgi:hypothetical protein